MKGRSLRKLLSLFAAAAVFVGVAAIPASSASRKDIADELSKLVIAKYAQYDENGPKVGTYIQMVDENVFRNYPLTAAQGDQLVSIIQHAATIITADKGPTADKYSVAEQIGALDCVDQACNILGWTWACEDIKTNKMHEGDIVFKVFDKDGHVIFVYDGDVPFGPVRPTGDLD